MCRERGDQSLLHVITSIRTNGHACASLRGTRLVSEQTLSAIASAADPADDRSQQCGKIASVLVITDMFYSGSGSNASLSSRSHCAQFLPAHFAHFRT